MVLKTYKFALVLSRDVDTDEEILEVAEALGDAGCLDSSVGGHPAGAEVWFAREADSLEAAIVSAFTAVEGAGYPIVRVEMEPEDFAGLMEHSSEPTRAESTPAPCGFSLILPNSPPDVRAALGKAGSLDSSIGGHVDGTEVSFAFEARSLEAAVVSAVSAVRGAGCDVSRVEIDRQTIEALMQHTAAVQLGAINE